MMKSFHLDLSLSRDLELLRVSRLTNANTGKKSDNRHMAGTASRECVSVGSDTQRRTQPGVVSSPGDRAECSGMVEDSVMFPDETAPATPTTLKEWVLPLPLGC